MLLVCCYKDSLPSTCDSSLKVGSEQEEHAGEGISVRSIQAEGKDDIMRLSEQIAQL